MKVQEILEAVKKLSAVELAELVDGLKEAFGIDDSMLTVSAGGGASASADDAGDSTNTQVKVVIESVDETEKMSLIKAVKTVLNIGLADAKGMVDKVAAGEVTIKGNMNRPEAEALLAQFAGVKAKISIKA